MVAINSGSDWLTYGGNRRNWSIQLNDDDGIAILGPEKWNEMSWAMKKYKLQNFADLMVLQYMVGEDAITKDFFEERVAAIKARPAPPA